MISRSDALVPSRQSTAVPMHRHASFGHHSTKVCRSTE